MYIKTVHFQAIEAAMELLPHDDPATIDIVRNAEAAIEELRRMKAAESQKVVKRIMEKRKTDPNYAREKARKHE